MRGTMFPIRSKQKKHLSLCAVGAIPRLSDLGGVAARLSRGMVGAVCPSHKFIGWKRLASRQTRWAYSPEARPLGGTSNGRSPSLARRALVAATDNDSFHSPASAFKSRPLRSVGGGTLQCFANEASKHIKTKHPDQCL